MLFIIKNIIILNFTKLFTLILINLKKKKNNNNNKKKLNGLISFFF